MLGIHIGVAVAWQRASSGGWTTDAADCSRRQREPADIGRARTMAARPARPRSWSPPV